MSQRWYPESMQRFFPLILVVFLASCATFSSDKGDLISRPFTAVDTNHVIVLSPNRTFEIVLPSNPDTGCRWELSIDHPEVVSNTGYQYTPDRCGRACVGGETTWFQRTRKTGNAILTFSYQQPHAQHALPTRVVTFEMVVR